MTEQPPYTLDSLAGPRPARRRPRWIWAAVAAVVAVVVAGLIGIGYALAGQDEPAATAATSAPTPRANEIECVNIDRAYNAWANSRLRTAHEFEVINEVDMLSETEDQKALLNAVQGYNDQPSKELALAVAELGVELGMLNFEMKVGDGVTAGQAAKAAAAHRGVREKYAAWSAATCA